MTGGAADALRPGLFADLPVEAWPPEDSVTEEPWASFVRARRHLAVGDQDLAIRAWVPVATFDGWDARHRLQAWHFLRGIGVQPDAQVADRVLGVVAEVAVGFSHDVLAVYADGSVRYLGHDGGAAVIESGGLDVVLGVTSLLAAGQTVADLIGPWDGPELPPLPVGHSRFTMLTPSGPHLGQGPDDVLRADPMAEPLFRAATGLLLSVVALGGS